MPAQQSKFILDLSKPLVVLWHREGETLTRLTRVSVHDSQLVQKLRANRISAEENGFPSVEVQLPPHEVHAQFIKISSDSHDQTHDMHDLLRQEDPNVECYVSKGDGFYTVASVSRDILAQANDFAKGIGLEPICFTCPDLLHDLGVVPIFEWTQPAKKKSWLPKGLAAVAALFIVTAGLYWQTLEPLGNAAYTNTDLSEAALSQETATPASAPITIEPDFKVWNASTNASIKPHAPQATALEKVKDIREIARSSTKAEFPFLLKEYVPHAQYRVAQALSGTVSDQTRSITMSPNLRPFTLGGAEQRPLLKARPKLRPSLSSVNTPKAVTVEQSVEVPVTEAPSTSIEIAEDAPVLSETAEPSLSAADEPSPIDEPSVEIVSEAPKEETSSVNAPSAITLGTDVPRPRLRPSGLEQSVATAIAESNKPTSHPEHRGFTPKTRPSEIQNRAVALIQAKEAQEAERLAAEKKRTDELVATAKAEELARVKQEQIERQQKEEADAIAREIERNKPKAKPYAYPDLRPRNFARTVSRIKANEKARAASAPKTTSTTSASVNNSSTEKTRIKNGSITLIGISGKPSARKAVVKLRGGSYKTVKKGQTVAGWRISAIGESSVRIRKGSRDQVLRMPK